jgi:hypothetical protein
MPEAKVIHMEKPTEEFILDLLAEIRDSQKLIEEKITRMDRDMEITRNGFTPHQIVEMLHYVAKLKEKEEQHSETVRKAIITWIVPIVMTAVVSGFFMLYK